MVFSSMQFLSQDKRLMDLKMATSSSAAAAREFAVESSIAN
jgi:hypothetical protein